MARFAPTDQAIEDELAAVGIQGAAVAIIEGGEVTFARGYGYKDDNYIEQVEPTTLFRMGSVGKGLTAIGLLQLVESGDVDLAAPVTDYVPGFHFTLDASWAPSISVEDLLMHTSGIVDYLPWNGPTGDSALEDFFTTDFVTFGYLMAPAGRMYNYSNPGFALAGLIIESVSGSYYRHYMQDNVFGPLGMPRTYLLQSEVLVDGDYATGHAFTSDNGWARPAGYAYSNVLDLAEYVKFLRAGDPGVLEDGLRLVMQQPQVDTEELADVARYGYGLKNWYGLHLGPDYTDFYEIESVWHNGMLGAFSAEINFYPDLDFGFVWMASCGANDCHAQLWESQKVALHTLATLPASTPGPDVVVDPAAFDLFTGEYHDPYWAGQVIVTQVGNDLVLDMPTLDASSIPYDGNLYADSPRNFLAYINSKWTQVTFMIDSNGDVDYLRTREFVASRVPVP